MTRLNKVKQLEERIAPSFIGFSGNAQASANSNLSANAYGNHVDSNASANVDASASASAHGGGWINPLLLLRALQQHGLVDASSTIEISNNVAY
jgi:hypothetical protein